jgi:cell division protease FtsH
VGNKYILDKLAEMLIEKETVDAEELQELLANNDVKIAAIA